MIEVTKIRIDGGTQVRLELNQSVVAEYAEAYREGASMPPVVVFYDGSTYWLADGFHRFFAAKQAGLDEIHEEITPGSQRDAVLYSLGANSRHGLRRSNADKRKAIETLLKDSEWSAWSSNEIAKRCGVGHSLVDDVRKSYLAENQDATATRTVIRNGTTYEQNTANIGTKTADSAPVNVAENPPVLKIVSDELSNLRSENEKLKAWGNENAQTAKELLEENNSMAAVFDQDERLSASVAECKKLREMNRVLEERIRGLMNEKNEAIRAAKSWQRKAEQAMKAA